MKLVETRESFGKTTRANAIGLAFCALLFALCVRAEAQQPGTLPRIGYIIGSGSAFAPSSEAFRLGLRELGYSEGKNILIEFRDAEGRLDRIPALVKELVQLKVDVIVAPNNVAIRAAQAATKTIPIVMMSSIDPVAAGYVSSLARPGGNITGISRLGHDLDAKRMELLRETLPAMARVAILWDADGPGPKVAFKEYAAAARAFKLDVLSLDVKGPKPELVQAFQAAKNGRADALVIVTNPLLGRYRKEVLELSIRAGLPTMNENSRWVQAGGLISYAPDSLDAFRRAAYYVDKILKGANPAELPVEQPTKFELIINLKTANQIGLTIPPNVLQGRTR
jgi:putative ABC transport system substrate-binding protein